MKSDSLVDSCDLELAHKWVAAVTKAATAVSSARIERWSQGYGNLQYGQSVTEAPLCLNGKRFNRGLGTHAHSEIVVQVSSPARRFQALVGMDDNQGTRGGLAWGTLPAQLIFSVEVNNEPIWRSPPLTVTDAPLEVNVDFHAAGRSASAERGARTFTLRVRGVRGTDDSITLSHANWADARVVLEDGGNVWLGESTEEQRLPKTPPFSFDLGGKSSLDLLPSWPMTCQSQPAGDGVTLHRVVWKEKADGLECIMELKEYRDFPAVEWVVRFRNNGTGNSPILKNIQALDMPWKATADVALHRSRGSRCSANDFLYSVVPLNPSSTIRMTPGEGKSSNDWLPFFNLQSQDEGVVVAVGWTGCWAAEFSRDLANIVRVRGGLDKTHLTLYPGEEIRIPRILLVFWKGEPLRGNNLLRRFILCHHTPMPGGKPLVAPMCNSTWGGVKTAEHLRQVKAIRDHQLPYDYYWVDAGWFGSPDSYFLNPYGVDSSGWGKQLGDWRHDYMIHPDGLKPLSDAVHDAGMKFLLWLEPERAACGTPLPTEHPEWFLSKKLECGLPYELRLFNLGIPEARQWMTDLISRLITEYGMDCYRQDFNCDPLPSWRDADAPDRQGMTEIRYIEGLYAFWDELLKRHPHLLIDNCASGGRRIDLEMIGRSIPLWRSDLQCGPDFNPVGSQAQGFGLSHWVPLSATGTEMRPGDTYNFRSAMSAGMVFTLEMWGRDRLGADYPWDWHRRMMAEHQRARPYYYGDFYPLTLPLTIKEPTAWMACQMHRPDLNEGMALAFRRDQSSFVSADFRLNALNPDATYEVEDMDSSEIVKKKGSELMESGLRVTMEKPRDSRLVFYRRLS